MALIEVQGLRKLYPMGATVVRALDRADLAIERGEFVAITGASGSGKSTMMHLLGCLDRPTSGRYFLDGRNVSELSDRELAEVRNRKIGFVFQTFNLINRTTAEENVAMPLFYARQSNTRGSARRALERVGLSARAGHQPSELSGGERQRVAIARAIVNDPVLLLADEPTGNLDSRTGDQIMDIFHDLNAQGVTIVMVTHEPDIAQQARRIIHMRDGRILSDAPGPGLRPERTDDVTEPRAVTTPLADDFDDDPTAVAGLPRKLRGVTRAAVLGLFGLLGCGLLLLLALGGASQAAAGSVQADPAVLARAIRVMRVLAGLVGLAGALPALLLARGAARRMFQEPGTYRGLRRLQAARVFGWLAVLTAVAAFGWAAL